MMLDATTAPAIFEPPLFMRIAGAEELWLLSWRADCAGYMLEDADAAL